MNKLFKFLLAAVVTMTIGDAAAVRQFKNNSVVPIKQFKQEQVWLKNNKKTLLKVAGGVLTAVGTPLYLLGSDMTNELGNSYRLPKIMFGAGKIFLPLGLLFLLIGFGGEIWNKVSYSLSSVWDKVSHPLKTVDDLAGTIEYDVDTLHKTGKSFATIFSGLAALWAVYHLGGFLLSLLDQGPAWNSLALAIGLFYSSLVLYGKLEVKSFFVVLGLAFVYLIKSDVYKNFDLEKLSKCYNQTEFTNDATYTDWITKFLECFNKPSK